MLLHVKVKPNSKIDEIIRDANGLLKVKIKAPATEGRANKYLVAYLAEVLGTSKSKITLLKGSTNQHKTLNIEASEEDVMKRISESVKPL